MFNFKHIYRSIILILFLLFCSSFYYIFFAPNILINKADQRFNIKPSFDFNYIVKSMKEKQILKNEFTFRIVSKLFRYGKKIYSGSYYLNSNMNNFQIIRMLRSGLQKPLKIVLYDIKNKQDLVNKVCNNLYINSKDFIELLNNEEFIQTFGFNKENILAMFIPNTYEIYWNISLKKLFKKLYSEYIKFWNTERIEKCNKINLSKIEASILASIVQAETSKDYEAPIIAGVYLNRLKRGMRLQADPTLKHANSKLEANRILNKYKLIDSPYNTYKYKGLPPGPINVPKILIIDAVLNYKNHNFLYMAAKEDFAGEHYFSTNYIKHIFYARKYRNALNKRRIFN